MLKSHPLHVQYNLRELVEATESGETILGDRLQILRDLCRLLLITIGEDPKREGLVDTPRRFADWWKEFMDYDPGNIETTFESITTDQMVIVRGVPVWSLCEHHLLPFHCLVSVGYLTHEKVLGLSKFPRVIQSHAHNLQLQEKLVKDVAEEICRLTGSPDVAVYAEGEHLCLQMRGIKSQGEMITSVMLGAFRDDPSTRSEFLSLIRR